MMMMMIFVCGSYCNDRLVSVIGEVGDVFLLRAQDTRLIIEDVAGWFLLSLNLGSWILLNINLFALLIIILLQSLPCLMLSSNGELYLHLLLLLLTLHLLNRDWIIK
jgi:hypothetical protein